MSINMDAVGFETGETTLYTWQGLRPGTRTEPSGGVTSYVYVDDRLAETTEPSGNVVTYTYEPGGLNFDDPTKPPLRRIEDTACFAVSGSREETGSPLSPCGRNGNGLP